MHPLLAAAPRHDVGSALLGAIFTLGLFGLALFLTAVLDRVIFGKPTDRP